MSDNNKLVDAIRRAAGRHGEDRIEIFTGIVMDNSDAFDDGTITVKQVTGKIINSVNKPNLDYTEGLTEEDVINTNDMIYTDVELQPSPGDYAFVIPSVDSYVRVCVSTFQPPFVLQIQDVDSVSNAFGDITSHVMDKTGSVITASASSHAITPTGHILSGNEDAAIQLMINNGAEIKIDKLFHAKSINGAEIGADTLIKIKNSSTSLLEVMQNFITALNTGANSGGTVVFSGDPGFTNLLAKISTLLDS